MRRQGGKRKMAADEVISPSSIECVDNPCGIGGVVVDGDQTYPLPFQQDTVGWTASGDGQGPHSSVRPFHFAHYEYEDPATQDDPETDSGPLSSPQGEEEEEEEEEEEKMSDIYSHQPST